MAEPKKNRIFFKNGWPFLTPGKKKPKVKVKKLPRQKKKPE